MAVNRRCFGCQCSRGVLKAVESEVLRGGGCWPDSFFVVSMQIFVDFAFISGVVFAGFDKKTFFIEESVFAVVANKHRCIRKGIPMSYRNFYALPTSCSISVGILAASKGN
jgi:hypothetical protein